MGQERMAPWRRRIFTPIPLFYIRPPSRWHCALTPPSRATSHKIKRSSPALASYICRRRTPQPSRYIIGSPLGPSSRIPLNTNRRPDTTWFTLHLYHQKGCGHAYTPNTPYRKQSPSDSPRRILPLPFHWFVDVNVTNTGDTPDP